MYQEKTCQTLKPVVSKLKQWYLLGLRVLITARITFL